MGLASLLAVIGAVATVIYAAERVLAATSHLIRACIPVIAALQELTEATKRMRAREHVVKETPDHPALPNPVQAGEPVTGPLLAPRSQPRARRTRSSAE
jgi:hypothetical protein